MRAREVEERLIAVGLDPAAANVAVKRGQGKPSAPPPAVDWAMEHARAALRAGLKVPDIERQLIVKGLPPEIAEAVVTNVLGERVRAQQADTPEQQRRRMVHWIASGVVACGCVLLGYGFDGVVAATRAFFAVMLPLACIWFGDLSGPLWSRFGGRGPVLGVVIRWLGWLVLFLYFLYRLELVLYPSPVAPAG
jgi:hypothetical protein